jgi:hypothetical protein
METALEPGLLSSQDYRRPRRIVPLVTGSAVFVPVAPPWLEGIANRCQEFTELASNWDTYGAPPVSSITARAAVTLLARMAPAGLPAPHVFPTAQGGVQFEWQMHGRELEIAFDTPTQVSIFFLDENTNEEIEQELTNSLRPLSDLFSKLDPSL